MSVHSEIDRIAGAKSDIATAITNKGVTVPSGTKLDGMAALIDSISGGEDVIIKQVTFKPSSNYLLSDNRCVVTHNCGKIPKAVFIFSDNTSNSYVGYGYIFNFSGSNDTTNVSMYVSFGASRNTFSVSFTTTTMKFTRDGDQRYKSGKNYYFTFVC